MVRRRGIRHDRESAVRPVELSAIDHHPADARAVTADVLGRGVQHDVGAPLDRPAQIGSCEGVVDQQRQIVLVRNGCDRFDIEHVAAGVERRRLGGEATRERHPATATLEARDAFLEHRQRRVHDPRVGIAVLLQVEIRRGRGRVLEDVAGGLKNRHRTRTGIGVRTLTGVNLTGIEAETTGLFHGRGSRSFAGMSNDRLLLRRLQSQQMPLICLKPPDSSPHSARRLYPRRRGGSLDRSRTRRKALQKTFVSSRRQQDG